MPGRQGPLRDSRRPLAPRPASRAAIPGESISTRIALKAWVARTRTDSNPADRSEPVPTRRGRRFDMKRAGIIFMLSVIGPGLGYAPSGFAQLTGTAGAGAGLGAPASAATASGFGGAGTGAGATNLGAGLGTGAGFGNPGALGMPQVPGTNGGGALGASTASNLPPATSGTMGGTFNGQPGSSAGSLGPFGGGYGAGMGNAPGLGANGVGTPGSLGYNGIGFGSNGINSQASFGTNEAGMAAPINGLPATSMTPPGATPPGVASRSANGTGVGASVGAGGGAPVAGSVPGSGPFVGVP